MKLKRILSVLNGAAAAMLFATSAFAAAGETPDLRTDWNELWRELLIDISVIGVIFIIAALYMLMRFKASSPDQVGTARRLSTANAIGWALIPAAIFMADDFFLAAKAWTVWDHQRTVPENAMEIKATGYQWYWEFEYENGTTTDELVVPVGTPVVMRMTSDDVIHSFGLPYFRVTEDVMPGRVTYLWFNPIEEVETLVTCREFCGASHSEMYTSVKAVSPADFQKWLAEETNG